MERFVHLHVHDQYSLLDGFGSATQYVQEASRLGMRSLALTNHGNVDGCLKFQRACGDIVKPVFGCELYIVENASIKKQGEKRFHITCLVEDVCGWTNLLKIITRANMDGFYARPRTDPASVVECCDGMTWMSGCMSSPLVHPWGRRMFRDLSNRLGREKVFVEVIPHAMEEQANLNRRVIDFGKSNGLGIVATNDCHYPLKEDSKIQEVLLAIQRNAKWKDPKRWRFSIDGLHLRTAGEMMDAFREQGAMKRRDAEEAIEATSAIASRCHGGFPSIPKRDVELPKVPCLGDEDDDVAMWRLVKEGFDELVRPFVPKKDFRGNKFGLEDYRARVKEEMKTILDLGFQRYFLIVWELFDWCRGNDVGVGPGRGSSGGSLVAYLLKITWVDPLEHGLLFTRFVSPSRIDLPDIDMDFEDRKRHMVRGHLEDMYGKDCVAGVSTFMTMKGKAVVRDVGRVFDLPYVDVDRAARSIVVRSMGDDRASYSVEDAFETFEDGKRFKAKYPREAAVAVRLEGQARGSGQHAAGMCVSGENLRDGMRCSLTRRSGNVVVNWDKHDIEHFGLMKLDVLGLSALSVLADARDEVKRNHGIDVDYRGLSLDDPDAIKVVADGRTVGVFQLGSPGLRRFCASLGVTRFRDIVDATSLWRPGTLRAGAAGEFVERKNGRSKWEYVHPVMEKYTKDTYGIVLYQEQLMQATYDLSGLGWKNVDLIRKVVSKSQGETAFQKWKSAFVEGCAKKGTLTEKAAGKVWDDLTTFGAYGFNASHGVEYSMISYYDAYMKAHYPGEFMAASMTHAKKDDKADLIEESRRMGLKIVPPKVGMSEPDRWVSRDGKLLVPLLEVKGIGPKACEKIMLSLGNGGDKVGFFSTKDAGLVGVPRNIDRLLNRVSAYDREKVSFSDEEIEEISGLFDFDLSQDPMRRVRGIMELLSDELCTIEESLSGTSDRKMVFGNIYEVKFGYKKAVKSYEERGDVSGGVYGYIKDDTAAEMITFTGDLYRERKDDIEHCEGKWVVARVSNRSFDSKKGRIRNMSCDELWLEEDLISCGIEGMGIDMLTRRKGDRPWLGDASRRRCSKCEMGGSCGGPVGSSPGRLRAAIIGEAPGVDEDREGVGFVGRSGKLMWDMLGKKGYDREMFHVGNVVKCFPGKGKTPTLAQIKACSAAWLDEEMRIVRPVVVLVLGNSPLAWLTGKASGIMAMNGRTEWNPKLSSWVCYCVHPASALHSVENMEPLRIGLENFVRSLRAAGGES